MRLRKLPSLFSQHYHLIVPAVAVLLIHFVNNAWTTYGIFRDELYYIACSEKLAFGYVDQPPFSAFLLFISRSLFGDSVFALRVIPSFAHAVTVILSGIIAGKSGGGRYAQVLTAVIVGLAPGLIGMFGIYSMNAIEIVLWSFIYLLLFQLIESRDPRYWYWIGLLLGIGLLNKISMSWLGTGILAGLILTEQRYWLKTMHPYAAAAISLMFFLPYVLWNIQHDFAHAEFAANASRIKYSTQNPMTFFSGMIELYNPVVVPVLAAGFTTMWKSTAKKLRPFGIILMTVLSILIINIHSKTEYFNPAAVLLIATGTVQIERWIRSVRRKWIGTAYLAVTGVTGILIMPMAIDILPVHTYVSYSRAIGISVPSTEGHDIAELPQHFADRFGWKELAENVSAVYHSLPPEERRHTAIYTQNYGQGAAIDFYGKHYGLPGALSGHNNYWIWGSDRMDDSIAVLIAVGGKADDYKDAFQDVRIAGIHRAQFAMPYENNLPIFICRTPVVRIKDVWHTTKSYI